MTPITRRRLLASAGIGAAGVGLGAGGYLVGHDAGEDAQTNGTGSVPFYGEHQAGIATAAQDRLHFAAFDLVSERRADLRELMREWSRAAAEMAAGRAGRRRQRRAAGAAHDTGETVGLPPPTSPSPSASGRACSSARGLGLKRKRPAALRELPPLPGDELVDEPSGGDLCVQACADDPQVAFHAVRNLARIGARHRR